MKFQPKCDGPTCSEKPVYECGCRRCDRESPDERFYSCLNHKQEVKAKHWRIRESSFEGFDI